MFSLECKQDIEKLLKSENVYSENGSLEYKQDIDKLLKSKNI